MWNFLLYERTGVMAWKPMIHERTREQRLLDILHGATVLHVSPADENYGMCISEELYNSIMRVLTKGGNGANRV